MTHRVSAFWLDRHDREREIRGHYSAGSAGSEPTWNASWTPGEPPRVEQISVRYGSRWISTDDLLEFGVMTRADVIDAEESLLYAANDD